MICFFVSRLVWRTAALTVDDKAVTKSDHRVNHKLIWQLVVCFLCMCRTSIPRWIKHLERVFLCQCGCSSVGRRRCVAALDFEINRSFGGMLPGGWQVLTHIFLQFISVLPKVLIKGCCLWNIAHGGDMAAILHCHQPLLHRCYKSACCLCQPLKTVKSFMEPYLSTMWCI